MSDVAPQNATHGYVDDRAQELDEAFRALLEGLRTTLPGVEVMLAFLLVLPLQSGFESTGTLQRALYLVAVIASALAAVLLIAPSAHQRMRALKSLGHGDAGLARRHVEHVRAAVRTASVGTVFAAVAITAAVALACTFVLPLTIGVALGAAIGAAIAWTWFYMPLVSFDHD